MFRNEGTWLDFFFPAFFSFPWCIPSSQFKQFFSFQSRIINDTCDCLAADPSDVFIAAPGGATLSGDLLHPHPPPPRRERLQFLRRHICLSHPLGVNVWQPACRWARRWNRNFCFLLPPALHKVTTTKIEKQIKFSYPNQKLAAFKSRYNKRRIEFIGGNDSQWNQSRCVFYLSRMLCSKQVLCQHV